jgi:hypothetical protein
LGSAGGANVKSRISDRKKLIVIDIQIESVVKALAMLCASLITVHVVLTFIHYEISELPWLVRELFDVDEEESIPTWFSSAILLLASLTLLYFYHVKKMIQDKYQYAWLGLALGFLFMSVDEVAGFHETVNSVISYSWAILGLIVATVIFGIYSRFLWSLPASIAARFILAGAIFVGGAVGVELATEPYLYNDELDTLGYNLWTAVEEAMEMGGVIYFLSVLSQYASSLVKPTLSLELRST